MEYAMLSTLIPEEIAESFRKNSKHTMQDAASVLQWNLYRGFCDNLTHTFPIINVLPVGSFPQYYKYPFIRSSKFDREGNNIGFCNIKLWRSFSRERNIYKALLKWCASGQEEKTLFVYTISNPFLKAVSKVKKKYPNVSVCAIVADLPDMSNLSSCQSLLKKAYIKLCSDSSYSLLTCVDSFVLLTCHMAEYMNINQPFCVMEGIASFDESLLEVESTTETSKNIVYTGTLHRKFGILCLLEAFRNLPDSDVRLIICGVGDSETEIKKAASEDSRIKYMGQQPREKVLEIQKSATVLVNPRQNNEVFTKYSFPSKTMEYLASGVPVIAYKLDGIPDEYDEFLIYPEDDSVHSLTKALKTVCSYTPEFTKQIGDKGKKYVLTNKNRIVQTKRILEFLELL